MCDTCGVSGHCSSTCPQVYKEANALYSKPINDPLSNTYNAGTKNYPKFSYKNLNVLNQPPYQQPYNPPGFIPPPKQLNHSPPHHHHHQPSNVDTQIQELRNLMQAHIQSSSAHMKMLETQVTQFSQQQNMRAPNQFSSQPQHKGKEPSKINVVIEVEGKELADTPLQEVFLVKPIGDTKTDTICFESGKLRNDNDNGKKSKLTGIKIDYVLFCRKLAQVKLENKYGKFFLNHSKTSL